MMAIIFLSRKIAHLILTQGDRLAITSRCCINMTTTVTSLTKHYRVAIREALWLAINRFHSWAWRLSDDCR